MGGSSRSNRTLVRPARHRRGRTRLMPVHDGMNNLPRRVATSQAVGDPALWRIRVSTGRCAPNIGQSRAIRAAPGAPGSDAIDAFTDRVHVLSLWAIRPIGVQRADPAETVALNRHVALALHQPCLVRSAYTWVEGVGRRFRSLAGLFLDGARRLTRGRLALLVSLGSRRRRNSNSCRACICVRPGGMPREQKLGRPGSRARRLPHCRVSGGG